MAVLKFRVYLEEEDSIYRDVVLKHTQLFLDLHQIILQAFEFDSKHAATFYRSNDHWQRGREISLAVYDKEYKVPPLLMSETAVSSEIRDTNQKFVYIYDFVKNWVFLVELIGVTKEENSKTVYPSVSRKEGISPLQYGTRGLLGPKFADVEEKYDLKTVEEGFTEEGEETEGLTEGTSEDSEEDF